MKLIIDIPEEDYNVTLKTGFLTTYLAKCPLSLIRNGIPLDDVKAEIVALPKTYPFVNHIDTYVKEDDVLQILDNIGKESKTN